MSHEDQNFNKQDSISKNILADREAMFVQYVCHSNIILTILFLSVAGVSVPAISVQNILILFIARLKKSYRVFITQM